MEIETPEQAVRMHYTKYLEGLHNQEDDTYETCSDYVYAIKPRPNNSVLMKLMAIADRKPRALKQVQQCGVGEKQEKTLDEEDEKEKKAAQPQPQSKFKEMVYNLVPFNFQGVKTPQLEPLHREEKKKECEGAKMNADTEKEKEVKPDLEKEKSEQIIPKKEKQITVQRVSVFLVIACHCLLLTYASSSTMADELSFYSELRDHRIVNTELVERVSAHKAIIEVLETEAKAKYPLAVCNHGVEYQTFCDMAKDKEAQIRNAEDDLSNLCCNVSLASRCPIPGTFIGTIGDRPVEMTETVVAEDSENRSCENRNHLCSYYCKVKQLFIRHFGWPVLQPRLEEVVLTASTAFGAAIGLRHLLGRQAKPFLHDLLKMTVVSILPCVAVKLNIWFNIPEDAFVQAIGEDAPNRITQWIASEIIKRISA